MEGPKGGILLAEIDIAMPTKEACIPGVIAYLEAREQDTQAEAYKEVLALQRRKQELLAITYQE